MALYGLVLYVVSYLIIIPGISFISFKIMNMFIGSYAIYDITRYIWILTEKHADQCALYFSFFVMFVYWVIVKLAERMPVEPNHLR